MIEETPALLIGEAAVRFRKAWDGPVEMPTSVGEVRDWVARWAGVPHSGYPLVLSMDRVPLGAEGMLLKFIEDSPLPLILLLTEDRYMPVLRSRMKTVVKRVNPIKPQWTKPGQALSEIEALGPDTHVRSRYQIMAARCPMLYVLWRVLRRRRNRRKCLSLWGGGV